MQISRLRLTKALRNPAIIRDTSGGVMVLTTGMRLGPYEIVGPVGAGGMGEVYRARDTRLDRPVAIKVLSTSHEAAPEMQERFEREARAISNLSHPHICTLYDVGRHESVGFLVMEFLEGETLEHRLARGPIPPDELLKIAIEIADALDKAHRQNVVHRDLKPGNVMLTKSGAKLMDFGLAKLHDQAVAPAVTALAEMATLENKKLTAEGMIVGTLQYMSPEQLEGHHADTRSDIFALGEVIYEMATGRPAFTGRSKASLIAAILSSEPKPISELQPMNPPALDRLVRTCLAKDPDQRWQTVHDLKLQLQWIAEAGSQGGMSAVCIPERKKRKRLFGVTAAVALLVALAAIAGAYWTGSKPRKVVRAEIAAPENTHFNFVGDDGGPPVVSPDGSRIVMSLAAGGGKRLHMRALDSVAMQPLAATDNARFPFWSPDSQWIGFFADGKLEKLSVNGGAPITLADAPDARGGSWGKDDVIVFAPRYRSGLTRVSAGGGQAEDVLQPDGVKYTTFRWPQMLPDGKHFLYLAANHNAPTSEDTGVFYASLDGKQNRRVSRSLSNALYASGYLLFLADTSLMAQSFDPSSGTLHGQPFSVVDGVAIDTGVWRITVSAAENGLLLVQPGRADQGRQLIWFDRAGKQIGTVGERDRIFQVQLSPDGKKAAASIGDPLSAIWIYDLQRNTRARLTFATGAVGGFAWSPDGKNVAFSINNGKGSRFQMYVQPSDGSGTAKPFLPDAAQDRIVTDWTPDGKYIVFTDGSILSQKLWAAPLDGNGKPFLATPDQGLTFDGQVSPNGRWIAYAVYDEGGHSDIFVSPFPPTGAKWQISQSGGSRPRWRRDTKELFYFPPGDNQLYAVEVDGSGNIFSLGQARSLFRTNLNGLGWLFDSSKDGQRFLVEVAAEQSDRPLMLVLNWTDELKNK